MRRGEVRNTQDSATATGLAAGVVAKDEVRTGHGVLRRARQMIARIVALHGGRIQRGSNDGR